MIPETRKHASDQRDNVAHERDLVASERDVVASAREKTARKRCLICDASKAIPLVVFIGVIVGIILSAGRTAWLVAEQGETIDKNSGYIRDLQSDQTATQEALIYIKDALKEIKADVKELRRP
jgi:hypothetical protein